MAFLVQRSDVSEFRRRYRWMLLVVIGAFLALVIRLFQLQVLEGDKHRAQARDNIVREPEEPTTRGVIRDAYGKVLAANRPSYNVQVVPEYIVLGGLWRALVDILKLGEDEEAALRKRMLEAYEHEVKRHERLLIKSAAGESAVAAIEKRGEDLKGVELVRTASGAHEVYVVPEQIVVLEQNWPPIARMLHLSETESSELKKKVVVEATKSKTRARQMTLLKADVDRDVVALLETNRGRLRGIDVVPAPVRYYPFGELGAHLIGYMREIDVETLARLRGEGYRDGDRLGAIGVERRWESYLRGQRGTRKVLVAPSHREITEALEQRYLEEPRRKEPIPGRDVSLTIDIELMRAMHRAMRGQIAGAIVAVDVRTGRLLGALSKPSFDPNVVSGGSGKDAVREAFRRLYQDPLRPTLDKTISAAYPPGSTYKPFSALAGLADRVIDPYMKVDCRGGYEYGRRYFKCTGVHREVNLHEAIVQSCNTYFYALGEHINIDRLAKIGMDFGFGTKTGIGVNPEARGRMPTRSWYARRYKGFRGGFTLNATIGQGATSVTVLQLALAYAALANGGTLYQPQVVRSIETSDGSVVQEFPPRVRRMLEVEAEHLSLVKRGLVDVVADDLGTAHKARSTLVEVAGKTGTAEVSRQTSRGLDPERIMYFNRDHAWFAGYAPALSPEIAIVVLVEHGGFGGKHAVPVGMKVLDDWQALREKRVAARASARSAETRGAL